MGLTCSTDCLPNARPTASTYGPMLCLHPLGVQIVCLGFPWILVNIDKKRFFKSKYLEKINKLGCVGCTASDKTKKNKLVSSRGVTLIFFKYRPFDQFSAFALRECVFCRSTELLVAHQTFSGILNVVGARDARVRCEGVNQPSAIARGDARSQTILMKTYQSYSQVQRGRAPNISAACSSSIIF